MARFTGFSFRRRLAALLIYILCGVTGALAQTLSGHVTLQGSDDHALATVRIEKLGIGSTAKLDGAYRITGIKAGRHLVEYSFVGYKTVQVEMTFAEGEDKVHDVVLVEAPIMLNAAFATPDGSDPARYILNQVWTNAERRYKANNTFRVTSSTVMSFCDFDVMTEFMPDPVRKIMMGLAAVSGYKGVMKLIFAHPDLDIVTTCNATCKAGKYKWDKAQVKTCNAALTEDEKRAAGKFVLHEDLYRMVYRDNLLRNKKAKVHLKGSYQDGDHLVYIIEATKGKDREVMHVVDETWDVKKYMMTEYGNTIIVEMRKAIGDLYMPVSVNTKLTLIKESPEEVMKHVSDDKEPSRMEKRLGDKMAKKIAKDEERMKRVEKIAERVKTKGIELAINYGMTLRYSR